MAKLVDQEIRCRITKIDVDDEDVVVGSPRGGRGKRESRQRPPLLRDQRRRHSHRHRADLTDYGAFVDIGGTDALLHIGDISWSRIVKSANVLTLGQQIEVSRT